MTSPLRSSSRHAAVRVPKPAPDRRRAPRHLRVVEPPARRARRFAVGAGVVAIVFGALLGAAVFRSMLVTGQAQLDKANDEIVEVQREIQRDRAELAVAQSPASLAAAAERIGMVAPDGRDWIRPPASPVEQTPGSADTTTDPTQGIVAVEGGGAELAAPAAPNDGGPET